ncbi:MAG: hypothetical protein IKC56_04975 [Clostridia bacterium]|nr:hypothetical protein [Clostridia bacterium]
MKRLLAITSILALAFTCTACGLKKPSATPSVTPSPSPSVSASASTAPTTAPSVSVAPSVSPTVAPSVTPSVAPSVTPSVAPSVTPSVAPSVTPSAAPSVAPSVTPSVGPAEPTDEEQLELVTFSNDAMQYDGELHTLAVGNLPAGAEVVYELDEANMGLENAGIYDLEEGVRKPGVYALKATVSLGNASRELFAKLTIRKAPLTIKIDKVQKELYAPHPEFTYTVSGLKGGDIFYVGEIPEELLPTPEPAPEPTPEELSDGAENPEETPEEIPEEEEEPFNPKTFPYAVFTGDLVLEASVDRYSKIGGSITATSLPESDCYNVRYTEGALLIAPFVSKLISGTSGGLKMNGKYEMMYNGQVITWQGVNYFDLWQNCFNYNTGAIVESWVQESMRGLEELATYNVKAIRFSASFFYHNWWQSCFMDYDEATDSFHVGKKAEEAIYVMHRIFNKAASLGIGLIPSVFWTHNQYKLFPGETLEDCLINTDSESFKFTQWYQDLLLENFNDHPALFMWEQGNEWNLAVDHSEDGLTSDVLIRGRKIWAEQIAAANVGYNRVIGSGDAVLRGSQYNLRHGGGWAHDTHLQHTKVLEELNPGITAVSSHIYTNTSLNVLISAEQAEYKLTHNNPTNAELDAIANEWRKKYYEDPDSVVAIMKERGYVDENGVFQGFTDKFNDVMTDIDTLEELFDTLITASKNFKSTCYVGECGPGFTYGETVLQHSKYRNSVLSNGLVIEGDKLNPGLIETYAEENGYYPDATYQDMLDYYMAVSKAQQATGLPLVLYWNYEYNANINRLNDQKKINQLNYWGDRSTATEFSVSLSHFGKALCMLTEVKALNDAWDEAHPNAYN